MSDETPFWKKEISLGRKKDEPDEETVAGPPSPIDELNDELAEIKAAATGPVTQGPPTPTIQPIPVAPAPVESTPQEAELAQELPPAAPPVLAAPVAAAPAPPTPAAPAADRKPKAKPDSTPFWKKDITFGRKRGAKEEAAPDSADAAGQQATVERKKSKFELPKLERRPRRVKAGSMPKRLVGLKIGASQIAAARIANNGAAELLQIARTELEHGIVVGGELRDPEKLAEALRNFFKEHGLPRRGVRLGIANNRIGVRSFEIAGIEDSKQLDNAIRFRAQEALPIAIDEAVIDYQILGERTNEEGQSVKRVLLVVAYRELVDRYITACNKAGLELVGIDLEAFALLRAMAAPRDDAAASEAALVVVSIGHERSTFAVSDGRVCEFTRVLEWGGNSLNVAIARGLNLEPSQAEPWKRKFALGMTTPIDGLNETQWNEMRDAVQRQIQSFARELVSSLQFYQSQPESLGIGEIVLTGGTAHLPGLAGELQRLIGVGVRIGDPLARVKVGKKVADEEQIGSLAVAIGLGIED